jgi:hypothetical protein
LDGFYSMDQRLRRGNGSLFVRAAPPIFRREYERLVRKTDASIAIVPRPRRPHSQECGRHSSVNRFRLSM